jgi:three-Cys-motif partner protein
VPADTELFGNQLGRSDILIVSALCSIVLSGECHMHAQSFGGPWTAQKLDVVEDYLVAYLNALKAQPFRLEYVDAFAGSGSCAPPRSKERPADQAELELVELCEAEAIGFIDGSARRALGTVLPFDRYWFIETSRSNRAALHGILDDYPSVADRVTIAPDDANDFLRAYCAGDWRGRRALVFLDPFGTEVEWATIEAISDTEAIDMWYLFPLGAICRMTPESGAIPPDWAARLTRVLGTDAWRTEFYRESDQTSLFDEPSHVRTMTPEGVSDLIETRLRGVFAGVAKPAILRNSKNSPLFLLCFAASNPRGAPIALRVANHLLKRI